MTSQPCNNELSRFKQKVFCLVQIVQKDSQSEREVKDQQIEDLNMMVDETRRSLQVEFETKVKIFSRVFFFETIT